MTRARRHLVKRQGVAILIQFLFRLSFGLAAAMACLSPKQVTSGYFRVHSYVLLGAQAFLLMIALRYPELVHWKWGGVGMFLAYFTGALWLYEKHAAGRLGLLALAGHGLLGALACLPGSLFLEETEKSGLSGGTQTIAREAPPVPEDGLLYPAEDRLEKPSSLINETAPASILPKLPGFLCPLAVADVLSGGLLLGFVLAAMLLGHWYLNTPTMQLTPLKLLIYSLIASCLLRGLSAGVSLGAAFQMQTVHWQRMTNPALFLAMRWLSGIVGTLLAAIFAEFTLRVPNTQSATGILYAGVVVALIGELVGLLLSAQAHWPL